MSQPLMFFCPACGWAYSPAYGHTTPRHEFAEYGSLQNPNHPPLAPKAKCYNICKGSRQPSVAEEELYCAN